MAAYIPVTPELDTDLRKYSKIYLLLNGSVLPYKDYTISC